MAYTTSGKPSRETKVLSLGLPRTGSGSMAEALRHLGYQDVYHGLNTMQEKNMTDWEVFERAADATFPCLPSFRPGLTHARADWDELFGPCEAITDVGSIFAAQLIEAYPEANVVVVTRDFEAWKVSMDRSFWRVAWGLSAEISIRLIEPLVGTRAGTAARKMMLGFFNARTPDEAKKNSRQVYDRHHRLIRAMVPRGHLLEYKLGQGWGPLCDFLGKEEPDIDFPWVNEEKVLKEMIRKDMNERSMTAAKVVLRWTIRGGFVGLSAYLTWRALGHVVVGTTMATT